MPKRVADELFADWRDMIAELQRAQVQFLVVGGFAVATHGHPRATKDIDFFLRPSAENAARAMRALRSFGAPLHGATQDDLARSGTILQLGVPPRRIDLITSIEGVTFDEADAERTIVEIGDLRIPVIGRKALIANKRAAGRHQDLADVEALEAGSPRTVRQSRPSRSKQRRKRS